MSPVQSHGASLAHRLEDARLPEAGETGLAHPRLGEETGREPGHRGEHVLGHQGLGEEEHGEVFPDLGTYG